MNYILTEKQDNNIYEAEIKGTTPKGKEISCKFQMINSLDSSKILDLVNKGFTYAEAEQKLFRIKENNKQEGKIKIQDDLKNRLALEV